jgi:hypothetical protein
MEMSPVSTAEMTNQQMRPEGDAMPKGQHAIDRP